MPGESTSNKEQCLSEIRAIASTLSDVRGRLVEYRDSELEVAVNTKLDSSKMGKLAKMTMKKSINKQIAGAKEEVSDVVSEIDRTIDHLNNIVSAMEPDDMTRLKNVVGPLESAIKAIGRVKETQANAKKEGFEVRGIDDKVAQIDGSLGKIQETLKSESEALKANTSDDPKIKGQCKADAGSLERGVQFINQHLHTDDKQANELAMKRR